MNLLVIRFYLCFAFLMSSYQKYHEGCGRDEFGFYGFHMMPPFHLQFFDGYILPVVPAQYGRQAAAKPPASRFCAESYVLFIYSATISALGANSVFVQCDTAQRAALPASADFKFLAGGIYAAGESDFCDVQMIFEQVVNDLDHALHGHGFL